MAPPNEKADTLHSALSGGGGGGEWGGVGRDGKFLHGTHGPTKDQGLLKKGRLHVHACDAGGLVSETSISDHFFINAAILFFCVDAETPGRTLRPRPSPPSSLCRFVPKRKREKTAKVKPPQSTSNRRSPPFLPASFSLPAVAAAARSCPVALLARFPLLYHSDVGHFTFVTSECP